MGSKNSTLHRILIVDDDPDITELLSYNLKKENYDTRTANDGNVDQDTCGSRLSG